MRSNVYPLGPIGLAREVYPRCYHDPLGFRVPCRSLRARVSLRSPHPRPLSPERPARLKSSFPVLLAENPCAAGMHTVATMHPSCYVVQVSGACPFCRKRFRLTLGDDEPRCARSAPLSSAPRTKCDEPPFVWINPQDEQEKFAVHTLEASARAVRRGSFSRMSGVVLRDCAWRKGRGVVHRPPSRGAF